MKVFYDYQIFSLQKYGGISRYFCELITILKKNINVEVELLLKYSNNRHLNEMLAPNYIYFLKDKNIKGKSRLMRFINKRYAVDKIKIGHYDILHPTYYDPYFLKYTKGRPFVLTIYDMIHEKYSQYCSRKDRTQEYKRLLAQRAKKIIAISENTKMDIVKYCGIEPEKIEVIYFATSIQPVSHNVLDDKKIMGLPERYLLFVGVREGYKNFIGFLKAAAPLLNNDKSLNVVCTGGGKFSSEEKKLFKELGISNRIFQYSISNDEETRVIYQRAAAFIYPSLYEGFGIPILESFACRCPVLLSRSSSFPELAGEAAIYFDPIKSESIKEAIAAALYNNSLRQDLTLKGLEQLKNFSWEKTVQKTKELYLGMI